MPAATIDPDRQARVITTVPRRGSRLAAGVLAFLLLSAPASAQMAPAAVQGTVVSAQTHLAVEGARVAVLGTPLTAVTDSAGRFLLSGIAAGMRVIQARAIGFTMASWLLQLDEGRTARHELALEPRVYALSEIRVDGAADRDWRSEASFELRRARGTGYFFTREEIALRRPGTVSELLVGVPGVQTVCRSLSCTVIMRRTSRPCTPDYFLDGHPATNAAGPSFPVHQIRGIEVYNNQFEVPAEFQRNSQACGVIAIWTVDTATPFGPRRRPGTADSSDTRDGPLRRPPPVDSTQPLLPPDL